MATLTATKLGPDTGLADLAASSAVAAAVGGDAFLLQGREILVVNNAAVSPITVTVVAGPDNFGITNAAHDLTRTVGAGKTAVIGPLSPGRFRDVNGLAQITYSAVVTVTVGLFAVATTS